MKTSASGGAGRRLRLRQKLNQRLVIAVAVLAAGAWAFGEITQDVINNDGIARSDNRLLQDLVGQDGDGFAVGLAKGVTVLGTGVVVYGLLAVLGFELWRRTRRLILPLFCIAWLAIGQSVRLAISHGVARQRPPQSLHLVAASGFAYPSGHTATATVGYGLAAVLVLALGVRQQRLVVAAAIVIAAGVGFSRVYLGVHWPSDVMGGWTYGITWLALPAVLVIAARPSGRWAVGNHSDFQNGC